MYLFLTDFQLFKSLVGYNVPKFEEPEISISPGARILPFLSISDGFKIDVFAEGLKGPRVIAFGPKGEMLVSETREGRVVLLEDTDNDGKSDKKKVIIDGLNLPHGLDFYKDPKTAVVYLYIAESNQVTRYIYDVNKFEIINKTGGQNIAFLPDGGQHFTRTIAFGPNFRNKPIIEGAREEKTLSGTKLYISVGSSCDVCLEQSWKRAAILESDPVGSFTAEFAGGLRNAVFFTFHPITKEIWATEMGRDNLGDDLPPDEINIVHVAGSEHKFGARRYGWPFCYGNRVKDKTFNPEKVDRVDIPQNCSQTEPANIEIPAHSAPLGLTFVSNSKWPKEWQNNLLVAYHGSWNRSVPAGYKVARFVADGNGRVSKTEDFISGWLQGPSAGSTSSLETGSGQAKTLGRPVDLKFGPDGALYISDDSAGIIYRVISE